MARDRMAVTKLQRQDDYLILLEVVFRQFHLAVEDGDHVLGFELFGRGRVRTMTLKANVVDFGGA